jgi:hypothetical protein
VEGAPLSFTLGFRRSFGVTMNEAQKKVMIAVAIGIGIAFLFPPYAFGDRAMNMGYAFIANIPQYASVHILMLLAEWFGVVVIGGIFYFIAKEK